MANKRTPAYIKANLESQRYAFILKLLEAKGLDSSHINYCWDCEQHKNEEIKTIEYIPVDETEAHYIRVCDSCLTSNYKETDIDVSI